VSLRRSVPDPGPVRPDPISRLEERRERGSHLAVGTLACPRCDAPVALVDGPVAPAAALGCPYCGHAGAVRDFLSLGDPVRPQRVEVRVVARRRPA